MTPLEYITLHLQPDTEPTLTTDELDQILASCAIKDSAGNLPSDTDWTPTYDLPSAISSGWLVKAAKVAAKIDTTVGSVKESLSQKYEHCIAMSERWKKSGNISSISTTTRLTLQP